MRMTDRQADNVANRLVKRVNDANIYFLEEIGRCLKELKELPPDKAHQLIQILKFGGNYERIIKDLQRITNMNIKEIDRIFKEYAKSDYMFYKKFYKYRNKVFTPFEKNVALANQTKAISNIVKNELFDFTRENILGYNVKDLDGNIVFRGLRETYNLILDEAFLKIGQGKETFDAGMREALNQLGGSGLRTVEFESGRNVRLDSVVRTNIKARLRELHNENQQIIGEQIDADGVEISVHINPAPDHQFIQGKQFYNKEYINLQTSGVAKDVNGIVYDIHLNETNYRPVSELNCYHYIFTIIVGVSEPEYTNEQLQKIIDDNNDGFILDGKHYTNYEGTQLQRRIETEVRKQTDIKKLAEASGDEVLTAKATYKITQLMTKYKQISKASGLKMKLKRMEI